MPIYIPFLFVDSSIHWIRIVRHSVAIPRIEPFGTVWCTYVDANDHEDEEEPEEFAEAELGQLHLNIMIIYWTNCRPTHGRVELANLRLLQTYSYYRVHQGPTGPCFWVYRHSLQGKGQRPHCSLIFGYRWCQIHGKSLEACQTLLGRGNCSHSRQYKGHPCHSRGLGEEVSWFVDYVCFRICFQRECDWANHIPWQHHWSFYQACQHNTAEAWWVLSDSCISLFHSVYFSVEIIQWIAESKQPFQIVNDHGFQCLMKTGRPGYRIPSTETVFRDVKTVSTRVRKNIAKMLQ